MGLITSKLSVLSLEPSKAIVPVSHSSHGFSRDIRELILSYLPNFDDFENRRKDEASLLLKTDKISELSEEQRKVLSVSKDLYLVITDHSSPLREILKLTPCVQTLILRKADSLKGVIDGEALSTLSNLKHLHLTKIADVAVASLRNLRIESVTFDGIEMNPSNYEKDCTEINGENLKSWSESPAKEIRFSCAKGMNESYFALLGQLQGLKKIEISADITGKAFTSWRQSQLEVLHLRTCREFCDRSLELLADYLPNLKELILYGYGGITGTGFASWDKSKLQKITFRGYRSLKEANLALLGKLPNLKEVTFENMDNITGVGFANWGDSKLEKINLLDCYEFNDAGLACMGTLPHLKEVYFHDTRYSINANLGKGFKDWTQSPVQKIKFYGKNLNDIGLGYLGKLPKLQEISIEGSVITGEGFSSWSNSPVQKVDIQRCDKMNDTGLRYLGELKQLQEFIFHSANISGAGFAAWAESPVQKIDIANSLNQLNDTGLSYLGRLQKLQEFTLYDSFAITGEGFKDWTQSPVQQVTLDMCNMLNDTGLAYLGKLPKLKKFSLKDSSVSKYKDLEITGVGFSTWSNSPVQKINIQGCKRINIKGVALLGKLPKIQEAILARTDEEDGSPTWAQIWAESSIKRLIIAKRHSDSYYESEWVDKLIKKLGKNLPNVKIEKLLAG